MPNLHPRKRFARPETGSPGTGPRPPRRPAGRGAGWAALPILGFALLLGGVELPGSGAGAAGATGTGAAPAPAVAGPGGSATAAAPRRWFGSTRPPARNVLSYNNGAEPEIVDPGRSNGQPDGNICRLQWEGLTIEHPKTLEPLPGMALRWDVSPDGTVYTFHLRKAQWSDGHPVTAHDFVYSWLRVLNPATTARNAGLLYFIRNGEAFSKGQITDESRVGLAAPDDSTFVVTLNHPVPYFIDLTAFYAFMPVPRWTVEKHGDRWSRPENVVVNGAFKVVDWRPNNRFILEKNPTYWDRDNVRLDGVVAYSIDDLNTSLNLYKAGVTDWNPSGYLPAQFLPYVKEMADFRSGPYLNIYFYSFNVTDPTLANRWVRKALAWSVDREAICRQLFKGMRLPHGNYTSQGFAGYPYPPAIGFDPEKAREYLARAGYPGGKGMPKLDILFNSSEDHRKLAEIVQAMWKEHLGIDVGLSNQEWGSYLRATTTLHYQVARRGWIGDYADPNTFLATMITGDGNNRTGWSSAEYDSLLAEAGRTLDPAARFAILARAEALVLDEAPVLPIYNYTLTEMIKPYVRGIETNLTDSHNLKFAWIDREWDR